MWNKWLFKDLQDCISFKNHIERTYADLSLADKSGGAAAQENDSNDMSGDSSASEMHEDCGET